MRATWGDVVAGNGFPTAQQGPGWVRNATYGSVAGFGPEGQAYQQGLQTVAAQFQYQRLLTPLPLDRYECASGDTLLGSLSGLNQSVMVGSGYANGSMSVGVRWCASTTAAGSVDLTFKVWHASLGAVSSLPGSPDWTFTASRAGPQTGRAVLSTGMIPVGLDLADSDVIRFGLEIGGTYAGNVEVFGVFVYWEQVGPALAVGAV